MGATCSMTRECPDDGIVVPNGKESSNSVTTLSENGDEPLTVVLESSSSSSSLSKPQELHDHQNDERIPPFPDGLLTLLQQPSIPNELSDDMARFVRSVVDRIGNATTTKDTEALAVLGVLNRVMDTACRIQAATHLKDRGYPSEAMACLRYLSSDELQNLQTLIHPIQSLRLERWQHAAERHMIVEYRKFWGTFDLEDATDLCSEALDEMLHEMRTAFPSQDKRNSSKYGIEGMLNDTPSVESQSPTWSKEGTLNAAEQQKSIALWMHHIVKPHTLERLDDIYKHPTTPTHLLKRHLYSKTPCRFYGIRFVKVKALLAMKDKLVKFEQILPQEFTDVGHFCVSYRSDGRNGPIQDTLTRLQTILQHQVDTGDMELDDGVFLDWCCAPSDDPLARVFAKSIFEQCHVIFLPSQDYLTRPWCTFEYMTWLLSPFANQALGDYDMFRCIYLMCVIQFGRPLFVLDRPELQALGRICMATTDHTPDKDFLAWTLGENRIKSTTLRESLTKLIFKVESTITVA